jgi:hypothetical protein
VRTSRAAAVSLRYASTRILHLDSSGPPGGPVQLGYRLGAADLSSFGTSRPIGAPRTVRWFPRMAVNPDGAAIVAWHHQRRGTSDEIQAVWRPAGGRFGQIRTLQTEDIEDESLVGVGIDPRGRAVVAYARRTVAGSPPRLAVRVIDTRTGLVSGESRIAPPAGQRGPTEIAIGAGPAPGPFVVAWRAYPVTEGPTGKIDVAAAVLVGTRLGAAQPLARGDIVAYPRGPIAATVDAAGRAVVAFAQPTGGPSRSIPWVVQADAAGRFGAPQSLDTAGSIGALIRQDEGLAVGYLRETPGAEGHGDPLGVYVALRGPDGAFAASELVDDRTIGRSADGLQPPGLGLLPSGGLLAVYGDLVFNAPGGEARASTR